MFGYKVYVNGKLIIKTKIHSKAKFVYKRAKLDGDEAKFIRVKLIPK